MLEMIRIGAPILRPQIQEHAINALLNNHAPLAHAQQAGQVTFIVDLDFTLA